jgi:hypothetical protein
MQEDRRAVAEATLPGLVEITGLHVQVAHAVARPIRLISAYHHTGPDEVSARGEGQAWNPASEDPCGR